jgi:hypothetical protein
MRQLHLDAISNLATMRAKRPADYCWTVLRLGGSTGTNTFTAMEQCQDVSLWQLVGLELLTTRHPDNDCTLLHVAARTNNTAAVRELMAIWMNPLLRDREGRLATDAVNQAELREYAEHSLNRAVMRWYGPYLRQRVRTFLVVVQRWGTTRVRWLPRDIVHMIMRRVMAVEFVTLITVSESDANQRVQQFPGTRWTSRSVVDRAKARSNSTSSPTGKYMIIFSIHSFHYSFTMAVEYGEVICAVE